MFNTLLKNFGTGGEKSFFRAFNPDKNGKSKHQVFTAGDIVLSKDECQQNQWPMARIVNIETGEKNVVRPVTLRVVDRNVPGFTQVLRRPITKIVMLVGNNEFDSPTEELKENVQRGSHLVEARWNGT